MVSPGLNEGATTSPNSLHFTSLRPTHFTSLHFTSLHFTSLHFTSLHFAPLHFTSLHFTSLHFNSLHFTSLYFTSLTSNHFTSLYFTSLQCCQPVHRRSDLDLLNQVRKQPQSRKTQPNRKSIRNLDSTKDSIVLNNHSTASIGLSPESKH